MGIKIGCDVGFGDTKLAVLSNNKLNYSKETNAIVKLGKVGDPECTYSGNEKNVIEYDGNYYLVGESALNYPDSRHMTILDYDTIKVANSIIAKKILRNFKLEEIDYVTFTLSSAFRMNGPDFVEHLCKTIDLPAEKIKLMPQGPGVKVAIDKVGLDFDDPSHKDSYKDYLIVDIGFNTVDVSNVIDGFLMPEDTKGYSLEGVVKVAEMVRKSIKAKHTDANGKPVDISISRAKKVIRERKLDYRQFSWDCNEIVESAIKEYIAGIITFLEENYGERMDAITNVIIAGGGSEIIRNYPDQWIEKYGEGYMLQFKSKSEFANAIGALYRYYKPEN